MTVLSIILLVLFVIVSLLMIFMIAIQSEDNTGLGGVFGGSSDTAFGGQTNKVLNKMTAYVLVAFFVLSILIGVVNKTSAGSILSIAADELTATEVVAEDSEVIEEENEAASEI